MGWPQILLHCSSTAADPTPLLLHAHELGLTARGWSLGSLALASRLLRNGSGVAATIVYGSSGSLPLPGDDLRRCPPELEREGENGWELGEEKNEKER
jgi:hypothetical protein